MSILNTMNTIAANKSNLLNVASWTYAGLAAVAAKLDYEKTAVALVGLSMVSFYAAKDADRKALSAKLDAAKAAVANMEVGVEPEVEADEDAETAGELRVKEVIELLKYNPEAVIPESYRELNLNMNPEDELQSYYKWSRQFDLSDVLFELMYPNCKPR